MCTHIKYMLIFMYVRIILHRTMDPTVVRMHSHFRSRARRAPRTVTKTFSTYLIRVVKITSGIRISKVLSQETETLKTVSMQN